MDDNQSRASGPATLAKRFLRDVHLKKIGVIALALIYCGGLFVFGFASLGYGVPAFLLLGLLLLGWKRYGLPIDDGHSGASRSR